jgi:hypothetical protein
MRFVDIPNNKAFRQVVSEDNKNPKSFVKMWLASKDMTLVYCIEDKCLWSGANQFFSNYELVDLELKF